MALRQLRVHNYTVGWVCALPVELAAATVMLDETHQPPQHNPEDTNAIVSDPDLYTRWVALIGTNPAATVATWMQYKFPSIRLGLMVGIGGGVPGANVRLGDVVISQPNAGHGGVVHYDFGKTGPEGKVKPTGFLNAPPRLLLSATAKLHSNSLIGGDTLATHLAQFEGLQHFRREHAGEDVLFQPTYRHAGGPTCDECSTNETVQRSPRVSPFPHGLLLHYGTVASGNQVMKDGSTRDRLSQELGGVLCFEMEAAGLMNSFPCLVIRGICDYADSHKNKTWQPYAAAVAAACGKEILLIVPSAEASKLVTAVQASKAEQGKQQGPVASESSYHEAVLNGKFNQAIREGNTSLLIDFATMPDFDINAKDQQGKSALHVMAMEGGNVLWLLNRGANVEIECDIGSRPIHYAASAGHEKTIIYISRKGANLEAGDANGQTALHLAAAQGHTPAMVALLRLGADIKAQDDLGFRPLHLAILNDRPYLVPTLITQARFCLNAAAHSGDTPLHLAARAGHTKLTYLLIRSGAALAPLNATGETPATTAIAHHRQLDASLILCEIHRKTTADRTGLSLLQQAAFDGNTDLIDFLVEFGDVSVDELKGEKSWALRIAVEQDHHDAARLLLQKGADVKAKPWGDSKDILAIAAEHGSLAIVHLLLDTAASDQLKYQTIDGPLHQAARSGRVDLVRLLLDKGMEADPPRNQVESALRPAAEGATENHLQIVQLLLERGADVNRCTLASPDSTVLRATLRAASRSNSSRLTDYMSILNLLLSKGVDVHQLNQGGYNVLTIAASRHVSLVRLLLDKGVDPNGKGVLESAVAWGTAKMVQILLEAGANPLPLTSAYQGTLLHIVACRYDAEARENYEIGQMLVNARVPIDVIDREGQTALHRAVDGNYNVGIVRILLQHGANVLVRNKDGLLPLALAEKKRDVGRVHYQINKTSKDLVNDNELIIRLLKDATNASTQSRQLTGRSRYRSGSAGCAMS